MARSCESAKLSHKQDLQTLSGTRNEDITQQMHQDPLVLSEANCNHGLIYFACGGAQHHTNQSPVACQLRYNFLPRQYAWLLFAYFVQSLFVRSNNDTQTPYHHEHKYPPLSNGFWASNFLALQCVWYEISDPGPQTGSTFLGSSAARWNGSPLNKGAIIGRS